MSPPSNSSLNSCNHYNRILTTEERPSLGFAFIEHAAGGLRNPSHVWGLVSFILGAVFGRKQYNSRPCINSNFYMPCPFFSLSKKVIHRGDSSDYHADVFLICLHRSHLGSGNNAILKMEAMRRHIDGHCRGENDVVDGRVDAVAGLGGVSASRGGFGVDEDDDLAPKRYRFASQPFTHYHLEKPTIAALPPFFVLRRNDVDRIKNLINRDAGVTISVPIASSGRRTFCLAWPRRGEVDDEYILFNDPNLLRDTEVESDDHILVSDVHALLVRFFQSSDICKLAFGLYGIDAGISHHFDIHASDGQPAVEFNYFIDYQIFVEGDFDFFYNCNMSSCLPPADEGQVVSACISTAGYGGVVTPCHEELLREALKLRNAMLGSPSLQSTISSGRYVIPTENRMTLAGTFV